MVKLEKGEAADITEDFDARLNLDAVADWAPLQDSTRNEKGQFLNRNEAPDGALMIESSLDVEDIEADVGSLVLISFWRVVFGDGGTDDIQGRTVTLPDPVTEADIAQALNNVGRGIVEKLGTSPRHGIAAFRLLRAYVAQRGGQPKQDKRPRILNPKTGRMILDTAVNRRRIESYGL